MPEKPQQQNAPGSGAVNAPGVARRYANPGPVVTPTAFAEAMVKQVESDPGCKRKAMLFRTTDGRYLRFVAFEGEARVLTLVLEKDGR